MAHLPTVAIIGRPNTGKSTLFNRLVGRRQAIVSDLPGTTRDHIAHRIETPDLDYLLLDTGGMGGGTRDALEVNVHAQSVLAVEAADLILFTIDSREELTASDFEVVSILRKRKRKHVPVLIVLTKCDNPPDANQLLPQYHTLGIAKDIIAVSAVHTLGIEELQECIIEELKQLHFHKPEVPRPKSEVPMVALLGQPNVGKSSLLNALMSPAQRAVSPRLVTEIPGTTRDATEVPILHAGREYTFIDTAGLRRHPDEEEAIEDFAILRTIQALEHCGIVVLLLDALHEITRQDKRLVNLALEEGKGLILAVSKADRIEGEQRERKHLEVAQTLFFCPFVPVLFCSAHTGEGLPELFTHLDMIHRNRERHIPDEELRHALDQALQGAYQGALAKVRNITQAESPPPTFLLTVPDPKNIELRQLKFLERNMRSLFGLEGTPIRWVTLASSSRADVARARPREWAEETL